MTNTYEVDLENWEQFETESTKLIRETSDARLKQHRELQLQAPTFLYRGQQCSRFSLTTTLERYNDNKETTFASYNDLIMRAKAQIETFTGKSWNLPEYQTFTNAVKNYNSSFPSFMQGLWNLDGYRYLIHLRHHGFPSPLLDWSQSKYIAAFFAFRSPIKPDSEKVSIYLFCEIPGFGKIGSIDMPCISRLGPYVTSHTRHFLQQSQYTICAQFINDEWCFVPHERVISYSKKEQDVCWKFNLPWSERTKVLNLLDNYNLNAHSLFNSEESLMETVAFREFQ